MAQQYAGGYLTLGFPIINSIVNAGEQTYIQTFMEDQNYFYFSTTQGYKAFALIQQVQIDTDISLMPYKNIMTEYVTAIPDVFDAKIVPVVNGVYASVEFMKSPITRTYTRSFNKADDFFSYVGGLVGSILVAFFVVSTYSQKVYTVDIASKLFMQNQGKPVDIHSFNIFYFVSVTVKSVLDLFKCTKVKWPKTDEFIQCIQQMQYQLDISVILQKIHFLEKNMAVLFTHNQMEALRLKTHKSTIRDAKIKRKKLQNENILHKQELHLVAPAMSNKVISNDQISKEVIDLNQSPQINRQQSESASESYDENLQDSPERMKTIMIEIINDSKQGDQLSRRIIQKIDPEILSRLGLAEKKPFQDEKNKDQDTYNVQPFNVQFKIIDDENSFKVEDSHHFIDA